MFIAGMNPKWGKRDPRNYDPVQLNRGIQVEMEHTSDPDIAIEIAMDHLDEFDDYYIVLDWAEEIMKANKIGGDVRRLKRRITEANRRKQVRK